MTVLGVKKEIRFRKIWVQYNFLMDFVLREWRLVGGVLEDLNGLWGNKSLSMWFYFEYTQKIRFYFYPIINNGFKIFQQYQITRLSIYLTKLWFKGKFVM